MLKLKQKENIVSELNAWAQNSASIVAADYCGLDSPEMTELRALARKSEVKLRIARNTLARKAFAGTDYECMQETLKGSIMLAFSENDPGAPARLVRDFAKDHDKLNVKAISLGGTVLDAKQLSAVANLPTKDEAIAQLMSVMKAPIENFVRTLAEPCAKLTRTLSAVKDSKQA